jgi:hypothetical protein
MFMAGKILKRDKAKKDCEELGFQLKTPDFGKCVLQLIQLSEDGQARAISGGTKGLICAHLLY